MSLAAETLPCSNCRAPVDPLRAPCVAHFDEHFCYFCSRACADKYRIQEPERSQARPKSIATPATTKVAPADAPLPSFDDPSWEQGASLEPDESTSVDEQLSPDDAPALSEPETETETETEQGGAHPGVEDPSLSVDAGTLLLSLAVLGATLSLVLLLTGSSELTLAARLVVAAVATAALVAECSMGQRSITELHPLATLCGPVVAVAAAVGLRLSEQAEAESAIGLSSTLR